jgi:germination protein M
VRVFAASTLLAVVLVLAGCGSGDEKSSSVTQMPSTLPAETETAPPPTQEQTAPRDVVVYLLAHGRVQPVGRTVATPAVARAALEALFEGPNAREREVGLTSAVPGTTTIEQLAIAHGNATVDLQPCPPLAQVVFTLTQFETVKTVSGRCTAGRRLTRADFERSSPQILVESPVLDQAVESPVDVHGSANTFEATFQAEIVDVDGRVVAHKTVTATSGSGTRGTFDVSIPFEVTRAGGSLVVYESSAEDGSRIHIVEIPLKLQP